MNSAKTVAIALLLAALLLATLMYTARAAAPTPDLECAMLFGCWYVPAAYSVTEANSQWVWCPIGTRLGIGEWRMLWNKNEWRQVL